MTDEIEPYVDEIVALEGDRERIREVLFKVLKLGIAEGLEASNEIAAAFMEDEDEN